MTESEFYEKLQELNLTLTEVQKKQFREYAHFLLQYNERTNLTAIKNIEDVYLKHFYDSLLITKFKRFSCESILDIGSGAGFPGVPLKIVFPNIDLTLLDSNGKKTTFLNKLKVILNIDYSVINERAENFINGYREKFDVVVSRAVTAMPALAELSLPFVKIGGLFIPYKANLDESLENGKFAIEELGGEIKDIKTSELSKSSGKRTFVFVEKKCKTNEIYPRGFDKILKKPLQKK